MKSSYLKYVLVIAFFSFFGGQVFSQNCTPILKVEKDRNAKSVYQNGATFSMVITNTSSQRNTYDISTMNLLESCVPKGKKNSGLNVSLNVEIQDNNSSKITSNSITLNGGETRTFRIFVTIPPKTPYNSWSCIEVRAMAKGCSGKIASTILSVFVPKPSEG